MIFTEWMETFLGEQSPRGDLARDIWYDLNDECLDPTATWRELQEHIYEEHATYSSGVHELVVSCGLEYDRLQP